VPAGEIYDAAAAKKAPRPARHFPGFVELFSRQATGARDRARDPIEQRRPRKSWQVVFGEPGFAAGVEVTIYFDTAAGWIASGRIITPCADVP